MSTITSADQILVLHAGEVAEGGTHHELLEKKGRYYNMWRKQIKAERAMEQASQMVAKAKALNDSAERPGSSGNEGSPSEDASENEGTATKALVTHDGTLSSRGGSTLGDDLHNDEEEIRGASAGDRPNLAPGDRPSI